jgi:putative transposase
MIEQEIVMEMDKGLIDKLLADYEKPEDLIGENGLLKQLTKALVERAFAGRADDASGLREA